MRIELVLAARAVERNSRLDFALDNLDNNLFFVTSALWEDNKWTVRAEMEISAENTRREYDTALTSLEISFPDDALEVLTPNP